MNTNFQYQAATKFNRLLQHKFLKIPVRNKVLSNVIDRAQ